MVDDATAHDTLSWISRVLVPPKPWTRNPPRGPTCSAWPPPTTHSDSNTRVCPCPRTRTRWPTRPDLAVIIDLVAAPAPEPGSGVGVGVNGSGSGSFTRPRAPARVRRGPDEAHIVKGLEQKSFQAPRRRIRARGAVRASPKSRSSRVLRSYNPCVLRAHRTSTLGGYYAPVVRSCGANPGARPHE